MAITTKDFKQWYKSFTIEPFIFRKNDKSYYAARFYQDDNKQKVYETKNSYAKPMAAIWDARDEIDRMLKAGEVTIPISILQRILDKVETLSPEKQRLVLKFLQAIDED